MPLKYIGKKNQHITGVPARDLEDNEITELAVIFHLTDKSFIDLLIERGIYEAPPPPKKTTKKETNEDSDS